MIDREKDMLVEGLFNADAEIENLRAENESLKSEIEKEQLKLPKERPAWRQALRECRAENRKLRGALELIASDEIDDAQALTFVPEENLYRWLDRWKTVKEIAKEALK